jgi:hypothetical protein
MENPYGYEREEARAALDELTELGRATYEPDFDDDPRAGTVGAYMDAGVLCRELERDAQWRRELVGRS